jgi:hypothetical protein
MRKQHETAARILPRKCVRMASLIQVKGVSKILCLIEKFIAWLTGE